MDSIGVTYGFGTKEELQKAGATYIISRPEEIISIVGKSL
jgi:phosphoglycolate phosphatase